MLSGHCMACEHAERNAIYQAARHGCPSLSNTTAYVTGAPCIQCLRALICIGVGRIVCRKDGHYAYPPEEEAIRQHFIKESGIEVTEIA